MVPKLRSSPLTAGFLDSVNIGAVGVMIAVTIALGKSVLVDWISWVIQVTSVGTTLGIKKANALWIVLGGAILGYMLRFY